MKKNTFLDFFKSPITVRIKGKNLERFMKRVISKKIELLDVKQRGREELFLKIYHHDYEKIEEIKTIYDITLAGTYGLLQVQRVSRKNRYLLLFFLMGLSLVILLSNMIFQIKVVHTDRYIRDLLYQELKEHGIYEGNFRKSFKKMESIKNAILNTHKDKLEWLEIERKGTSYYVRVEERKNNPSEEQPGNRDVIAAKDGMIKSIDAFVGEIVKPVGTYVKAGDVIITGRVISPRGTETLVPATGEVFAEVWYQTSVEYPLIYTEELETGNQKESFVFRFLNHEFELSLLPKFKHKKIEAKTLLNSNLLPLSMNYEKQKEIIVKNEINTYDEAYLKALSVSKSKIEAKLNKGEYIIAQNSLKIDTKADKIVVEVFYAVYENITSHRDIQMQEIPPNEE